MLLSEKKLKDIVVEEFRRVCHARGLFEMTNRAWKGKRTNLEAAGFTLGTKSAGCLTCYYYRNQEAAGVQLKESATQGGRKHRHRGEKHGTVHWGPRDDQGQVPGPLREGDGRRETRGRSLRTERRPGRSSWSSSRRWRTWRLRGVNTR